MTSLRTLKLTETWVGLGIEAETILALGALRPTTDPDEETAHKPGMPAATR